VQLETADIAVDEALLAGWRSRVARARAHLGWSESALVDRAHASGVSLAMAAPCDQLFLATEVNEWALCATLAGSDAAMTCAFEEGLLAEALENVTEPGLQVIPPVLAEPAAFARFVLLAAREARPALAALVQGATQRDRAHVLDDTVLTLGTGAGGRDLALGALPATQDVPWNQINDVPTALVTGSNGKTTTVRLLAACARAHGWPSAFCCTDGVFFEDQPQAGGDYSGPEGARRVLRDRRAHAAVIETARGGILRRGLAVWRAQVAVVTNISADHFGEYGIDDLAGLADVKLTVAGVLVPGGLLVLNADDAQLRSSARGLERRFGRPPLLGWFSVDDDNPQLTAHRAQGGSTCAMKEGRLLLHHDARQHDLGSVDAMPLTVDGSATYNIANLCGAALAAVALGIPVATVAAVYARFGASAADNSGRLMRFTRDGVQILIDYAHNPEGMRGLLRVAAHLRGAQGRLGTILGQAGNRQDADIEALALATAEFHPDLVVVKESEGYLRGREPGELPRMIHAVLRRAGMPEAALAVRMTELAAVEYALAWARPGDVLALTVHSSAVREHLLQLLG
jgi:cyanophycin synthetase